MANVEELKKLKESGKRFLYGYNYFGIKYSESENVNCLSEGYVDELSPSGNCVKISGAWYYISRVSIEEEFPKIDDINERYRKE